MFLSFSYLWHPWFVEQLEFGDLVPCLFVAVHLLDVGQDAFDVGVFLSSDEEG